MGRGAQSWYRGVEGSRALVTEPVAAPSPAARAEGLAPGEMLRVPVGADLLGAARIRSRFAAIPLDAFDRACPLLEIEEQAAYLQLLRLSWAEGRNWCRVGKRELMARLRLSERRLLRVLGGLAARRLVRPVQRDNRGTLWRVCLPAEAEGRPLGDEVLLGRPAPGAAPARCTAPAPAAAEAPRPRARPVSIQALAEALCRARGLPAEGDAREAAAAEVADMLADGHGTARIQAAIAAVARRRARPEEAP
ncbi:MAG: hypothetical protein HZB56_16135 [Deltaproteobacteria bacterium]|nr:hypothetical protein [Deltaproteobacteria bacterium]